jgi:peptidoglycan/xylan/chitin deacetylase (PgdA/CDA1 family)
MRRVAYVFSLLLVSFAAASAHAQSCPGNPDAIGTSRVLPISFGEYTRLGTMQYPQTLPLADKEVVITFDDGPRPMLSDRVLDILASQCVKVTYFLIGQPAHYYPALVRKEYEAGHTIGTHSQDHPLRFDKLEDQQVQQEIDQGIASVGAALGDPIELAPFFRIPGLGRNDVVEHELAARSLIVFSADVVADDWFRHITPAQIIQRAMSRLQKRGGGILLLHDIHPATVLALPGLLSALKDQGFHIVHVVPAATAPRIVGGPEARMMASALPDQDIIDDGAAVPAWPQSDVNLTSDDIVLPAPDEAAFYVDYLLRPAASVVGATEGGIAWPDLSDTISPSAKPDLRALGVPDLGASLRRQRLVGAEPGPRPGVEVPAPVVHGKLRRHRHYRRARSPAAGGQHADLHSGSRVLTALLITPR